VVGQVKKEREEVPGAPLHLFPLRVEQEEPAVLLTHLSVWGPPNTEEKGSRNKNSLNYIPPLLYIYNLRVNLDAARGRPFLPVRNKIAHEVTSYLNIKRPVKWLRVAEKR